jgi:hypothetical protein
MIRSICAGPYGALTDSIRAPSRMGVAHEVARYPVEMSEWITLVHVRSGECQGGSDRALVGPRSICGLGALSR